MSKLDMRQPSGRGVNFAAREENELLWAKLLGVREFARRLGRSPSAISREVRRNAATRRGQLDNRASVAQWKAEQAARALVDRLVPHAHELIVREVDRQPGGDLYGPAVGQVWSPV